jgi:hypothetical protein
MATNQEREQSILTSLDQYDTCRLECDGLTRVLAYILTKEAIEHIVMVGEITDHQTGQCFSPHFWIALPDRRNIDYRARMWLGQVEHVPHGIFDPEDYPVSYNGETIQFDDLELIAPLLLQLDCDDSLA